MPVADAGAASIRECFSQKRIEGSDTSRARPLSRTTNRSNPRMLVVAWTADTVMDLSTGGDLDACREAILAESTVPIGTVPIYSMIIGRKIEDLSREIILDTCRSQAEQGVDYFTIHAGVLQEHIPLVRDRVIGIVSRGGSLLAKWMIHHGRQNLSLIHI